MTKLYEKSEITFALVWIALYVVIMNIALQFCGGFDDLAAKKATQLMIPVACILVLAVAVTFGMGHIVNLANTADTLGVLLQICYAMVIGFLYTVILWKGGSLWPCIASHMFVNGTSVFSRDQGLFGDLMTFLFGSAAAQLTEVLSALLIILISGGYALWLYKKA